MELRGITKEQLRIGDYFKYKWYFKTWYEKLILVIITVLAVIQIINWI